MTSIAVVNTKGGVGRTTLSAALAVCAAKNGARVAMVDTDRLVEAPGAWRIRGRR